MVTKHQIISGEFIELKEITPGDSEIIFNWRTGSSGNFMNQPDGYSLQMQNQWIANRPGNEINYMISDKASGAKVGMIAIVGISEQDKNAEIGRLLLGPEFLGKSNPYGLEALKLCAVEIMVTWKMNKIYGNVLSENAPMLKLQKYLGMKEEGLLKMQKSIKGVFYDLHLVALFKEDFEQYYLPRLNLLLKSFTK